MVASRMLEFQIIVLAQSYRTRKAKRILGCNRESIRSKGRERDRERHTDRDRGRQRETQRERHREIKCA